MQDDLSLVRFTVLNYFALLINSRPFQPISTLLIKLVESLIVSEPDPDDKAKERLDWIYKNTHEKVMENIAVIELTVFKNLDRGLNREIEVGEKSFYLAHLYIYLDQVSKELTTMVIKIAKKYSIDIPLQALGSQQGGNRVNI